MKFYITEIRKQKGLSIRGLAKTANVSKSNLAEIEKGNINPKLGTMCSIAKALDVSVHELFECE